MSDVPSAGTQLAALIRVTWKRLFRGRALWVCLIIALAPMLLGMALVGKQDAADALAAVELVAMTLLSPVLVSASIGSEIEDRTTTYLWSRPLPRWVMVVGKLLALAPIVMILVAAGWMLAILAATHALPPPRATAAFAVGGAGISAVAAGIATLVPRFGMSLSIVYIVVIDSAVGLIPASLQVISLTRQVRLLAGLEVFGEQAVVKPLITLALIAGVWLTIGLWRVRRLEA
jgi:ABC-type transport system involved in multi-copper enzyme maturation permease subunit